MSDLRVLEVAARPEEVRLDEDALDCLVGVRHPLQLRAEQDAVDLRAPP
jgi:hypothetical protein